jgi:hypothetical protein
MKEFSPNNSLLVFEVSYAMKGDLLGFEHVCEFCMADFTKEIMDPHTPGTSATLAHLLFNAFNKTNLNM